MKLQADQTYDPMGQAGYLEFGGAYIYSVLHGVTDPIARVLLAGPFASERYFSYVPWVRWARFLAARRIETLRFDYRGVGESTGTFEDMSFESWNQDVEFLARWLTGRSPNAPLILHGLELGGLLASKTFTSGVGDALLLWGTPTTGNEVLRRPLSRQAFKDVYLRKPASVCARELDADQPLEVEGYQWTGRLWRDSFKFEEQIAKVGEIGTNWNNGKPVRIIKLDERPASLLKGSPMGYVVSEDLDLSDFFADNFEWMVKALAISEGRQH